MNKKLDELYSVRVERFRDRVGTMSLGESVLFDAELAVTSEAIPFHQREQLEYRKVSEGDTWGNQWESAWCRLSAQVPTQWKGREVVANLDVGGEGLLFLPNGEILQGITNGSVFAHDFHRDIVPLLSHAEGGESFELWLEAACNALFGIFSVPDPERFSEDRFGKYTATIRRLRLCVFDREVWHLWLDMRTVAGFLKRLPEKSVRRARLLKAANDAIDVFADDPTHAQLSREVLAQELFKPASASDLTVVAIGHAHIDTAWLWPVRESIRKCARTFSNQLRLIERYPGYVFGASQPQHYAFVKTHYPQLYERIKTAVTQGSWELQGGMWVEADCNLASGESLARQLIHGKNFFRDEFGVDVKNLWLPDVFGYSATLPQLLNLSGIEDFLTQKISWNQFNDFPHTTFRWRGLGGFEVVAHFPPENTYNSMLDAEYLIPGMENFREKAYLDEFVSLFGVGDGGGGPKEETIECGLRLQNCEGAPRVKFGTAQAFFDRLRERKYELPVWDGELYLELHRGTLTTQAEIKRNNRKLEQLLREVEFIASCNPPAVYPRGELDEIWKTVLLNQFHDILPGSSIHETYRVTRGEHALAIQTCEELIAQSTQALLSPHSDRLVLLNVHNTVCQTTVELPPNWRNVNDDQGNRVSVQCEPERVVAAVSLPPCSFFELRRNENAASIEALEYHASVNPILENALIRYEFDLHGNLISAFDKELQIEWLAASGNALTLYDDHPNNWDAWDVDLFYENAIIDTAHAVEAHQLMIGDVRSVLKCNLQIGSSQITQTIILESTSRLLRFDTTVNWRERHRMLRVAFPAAITAGKARFDIQYGFIERPDHRNTSWDTARFEVAAQRYVDYSNRDYGIALLNDCKYGHKVHDGVLDLNLLRAPVYPDPDADYGEHQFSYGFYPHTEPFEEADVYSVAAHFNLAPRSFFNVEIGSAMCPILVEGDGVSLEVVKRGEKCDDLIIRVVETRGRTSTGVLRAHPGLKTITLTNLLEWEDGQREEVTSDYSFTLRPFEIRTYKIS